MSTSNAVQLYDCDTVKDLEEKGITEETVIFKHPTRPDSSLFHECQPK